MPWTTGLTNSRWLGFGAISTVTAPASYSWRPPAWYFTSPAQPPLSSSGRDLSALSRPSNSASTWAYGFPRTWARTLSRPRWAMPSKIVFVPASAARPISSSSIGIIIPSPSTEKRVCPG
jgi:hypothetical protein